MIAIELIEAPRTLFGVLGRRIIQSSQFVSDSL